MKFQRELTRSVAVLTTISLLLPAVVFALTTAPSTSSGGAANGDPALAVDQIRPAVITLQAQDMFGLLNGEIAGIPQFGLATDMGMSGVGKSLNLASRISTALATRTDDRYQAVPLPSDPAIGLPGVALVGNDATQVLLKASGQAGEAFKLTSPSSMPSLIATPLQSLTTIKNLLDWTPVSVPAAATTVGTAGTHRFGTVLTGLKPSVDTAPLGREWASAIFGSFTAELVLRLGSAPEGTFASAMPSWAAIWLDLLIGLAGLAALSRAQRGLSARHAILVILKRQQRE